MATFYAPQTGPTGGFRIGEALAAGLRDRADLDNASQLRRIREEEAARARAQEIDAAESRRIKGIGEQLALRGQILGTVETPEDYAAALPVLQGYKLPMGDLPQDRRSTASETFRRPEVAAPQIAPAWMPASWDMTQSLQNRIDLPAPVRDLPQGELAAPGIAPEEVATTVQRRAQIGLPLNLQQKYQDADLGRQIQRETLAAHRSKWASQDSRAKISADLANQKIESDITLGGLNAKLKGKELELAGPGGKALEQEIKDLPTYLDDARVAKKNLGIISQMKTLLAGGAGARPGEIKAFLGRTFGVQTQNMADSETYRLLSKILAGTMRKEIIGTGTTTDKDMDLLQQVSAGGLTGTKTALSLLNQYEERAREKVQSYNTRRDKLSKYDATIADLYDVVDLPGAANPAASSIPTVSSQTAYDALPPGAQYRDPAGKIKTKKAR